MIFNYIRIVIFIIIFSIDQYNSSINDVSSAFIYGQDTLVRDCYKSKYMRIINGYFSSHIH